MVGRNNVPFIQFWINGQKNSQKSKFLPAAAHSEGHLTASDNKDIAKIFLEVGIICSKLW